MLRTAWIRSVSRLVATSIILMACWPLPAAAAAPVSPNSGSRQLRVFPSIGRPGTRLTISGYVPAARPMTLAERQALAENATAQFGGIVQGVTVNGIHVHWSQRSPGDYTFQFRVPREPWLTAAGEHPLQDGHYPITVTCIDPGVIGCGVGVDARGSFTLTGLTHPKRQQAGLHLSLSHGAPGTLVHVSGWAPLTAIGRQPNPYSLTVDGAFPPTLGVLTVTQAPNGHLTGWFRVPTSTMLHSTVSTQKIYIDLLYQFGQVPLTIAATPFYRQKPLMWSALGRFQPQRVVTNATDASFGLPFGIAGWTMLGIGAPIAHEANDTVISSVPGWLWVKRHASWSRVATGSLARLSQALGYPVASEGSDAPVVTSVTLLPSYPHSLFVAMEAHSTLKSSWVPPDYNIAFYSTNDGATWHAVPVPRGYTAGDFGGYQTEGRSQAAYFSTGMRWTMEVTANGGLSWVTESPPTRPTMNPSLRFGPMQNGWVPGSTNSESILRENRQGRWVSAGEVTSQEGVTTLALLSPRRGLVIRPGSAYAVEVTGDDGQHWTYVQLPTLPGMGQASDTQIVGMMADGDLVAEVVPLTRDAPQWFILAPGARIWMRIPATRGPGTSVPATISGTTIEWLLSPGTSVLAPTIMETSQRNL